MSAGRPTLAILTHSTDDVANGGYLIELMIRKWGSMGFQVAVVSDADNFVPADVALLHVDQSVVPDSCRRLAERYPLVLNGRVLDIRKRRFSQLLVDNPAGYLGEVIVKTDLNYGGWPEFRRETLESKLGRFLVRYSSGEKVCSRFQWLEQRTPWRWRRMLPVGQYHVYATPDQVPGGVWDNPNLIVERFVSERAGKNYCCRHWLFFGHQEVTRLVTSSHPVVKADAKLEPSSEPVPEELRAIRAELGFDYGKFDYGIVDGKVVLYDVNRTPGATADPARHTETIEVLSKGLAAALEQLR